MGLTGMGGGALLTPMLVILFGVSPAAAVGSDLVTSLVAKPFGAMVHFREGTVNTAIVTWLCLGSVPAAFAGVLILRAVGDSADDVVQQALGIVLLLAAALMLWRLSGHSSPAVVSDGAAAAPIPARPVPTLLLGVAGGVIVGMTSVGSGSLMIAVLTMIYPKLPRPQMVGTDLAQAIPLVGSAAVAHLLFGHVEFAVTTALIVGSIPGMILGARVSARSDGLLIRLAIPIVLIASSLKLLNVI